MQNLTTKEIAHVNNLNIYTRKIGLGAKVHEIIENLNGNQVPAGTPVNAVNAGKVLTISGVVIDGETVTIGTDVYEFLADALLTKTTPTNIAVNILASTTQASRTLTVDTQPTSGDTMTIGTKVYTFVPNGTANADGEISIGTDLASAKLALVAAINGTDDHNTAHPLVSAGAFGGHFCIITALVGGTAGNSIATTQTFTAVSNVFAGVALAGGANCSAANAVTALVAAIAARDTQGVGATDGAGDTVELLADVAGVAGNSITLAKSMANATFAGGATALSGGINGTVGLARTILADSSYLYITVAENTVSGKNWRRISIGSAY